jgi:adenosylmethionine-8-amino-7-oxononanoate aminotransferase
MFVPENLPDPSSAERSAGATPRATDASCPSHEQLKQWDQQHVWHAFSQMLDYDGLIIEHAAGNWLVDVAGNRYLDGGSSLWCNVHGHQHPTINAAIRAQLDSVAHVTLLGMNHPTTIRLARRLVELSPEGLEHVFFSSDGSSAVEVALKLAFQFWQQTDPAQPKRTSYLAIGNAYHGDTIGSVAVGGVARFHAMFDPLLFSVVRGPCPDTYRLPPDLPEDAGEEAICQYYLDQYRRLIEQHSERLAAVVIEPLVQCAAGIVSHPKGFLAGLAKLAREFDLLLIADEIAVGMGRTGTLFACESEGVEPDLLCLGKGLTGGYLPMAATLISNRIWSAFLGEYCESRSFFHGHTYSGNALAAAAALATLDVFEAEDTLENVRERGRQLEKCLEPLKDHPNVGDIRRRGLIVGIELVSDRSKKAPFPWSERRGQAVCDEALKQGVWIRPIGNVVIAMPTLAITEAEVETLANAILAGVKMLCC